MAVMQPFYTFANVNLSHSIGSVPIVSVKNRIKMVELPDNKKIQDGLIGSRHMATKLKDKSQYSFFNLYELVQVERSLHKPQKISCRFPDASSDRVRPIGRSKLKVKGLDGVC
jgi:hypothetical protein